MAGKYYAVKAGLRTGIFRTWEECKSSVNGFSGAVYKSFRTREEALAYMENGQESDEIKSGQTSGAVLPTVREETDRDGQARVKIYVDGSYNTATREFSYGMVVLRGGEEEKYRCKFADEELASMRNVAGEIKGAQAAMQYALDYGIHAITIYHDYEGIARWPLGEWKANRKGTIAYREFYIMASKKIDIRFEKVAGHSGDKYNDMADELAKEALGIL